MGISLVIWQYGKELYGNVNYEKKIYSNETAFNRK